MLGAVLFGGIAVWNIGDSLSRSELYKFDLYLLGLALVACPALITIGKKLMARAAADVLAEDNRPPVIFLRPFSADERPRFAMPLGVRRGGVPIYLGIHTASTETDLAAQLHAIGPVVAIGAPGERLTKLGAARMYLADDAWQDKVNELLQAAAAVVLQPETSAGTRWEVMRVARSVDLRRVLLMIPNPAHRPLGYARVRSLILEDFPVPLPSECHEADCFMFDRDGKPVPLMVAPPGKAPLRPFIEQVRALKASGEGQHA